MTFKIGDVVRVKKNINMIMDELDNKGLSHHGINNEMVAMGGQLVTIKQIIRRVSKRNYYYIKEHHSNFEEEYFELQSFREQVEQRLKNDF